MKTPTNEQIDDIIYKHLPVDEWGMLMARIGDIDERKWLVEEIIRAWEKIKDKPRMN